MVTKCLLQIITMQTHLLILHTEDFLENKNSPRLIQALEKSYNTHFISAAMPQYQIRKSDTSFFKLNRNWEDLQTEVRVICKDPFQDYEQIFTNGSVEADTGMERLGAYIPVKDINFTARVYDNMPIFSIELLALRAQRWVQKEI